MLSQLIVITCGINGYFLAQLHFGLVQISYKVLDVLVISVDMQVVYLLYLSANTQVMLMK